MGFSAWSNAHASDKTTNGDANRKRNSGGASRRPPTASVVCENRRKSFAVDKRRRNATLKHARYVIGENPVTGFAFGLFVLIVIAAVLGPYIVPYDPLASDTTASLQGPSAKHWFGTDQLGRDVFSRVIVGARDILTIAPLATVISTIVGTALTTAFFPVSTTPVLFFSIMILQGISEIIKRIAFLAGHIDAGAIGKPATPTLAE